MNDYLKPFKRYRGLKLKNSQKCNIFRPIGRAWGICLRDLHFRPTFASLNVCDYLQPFPRYSEILVANRRKIAKFSHPSCIQRPDGGDPLGISQRHLVTTHQLAKTKTLLCSTIRLKDSNLCRQGALK